MRKIKMHEGEIKLQPGGINSYMGGAESKNK